MLKAVLAVVEDDDIVENKSIQHVACMQQQFACQMLTAVVRSCHLCFAQT